MKLSKTDKIGIGVFLFPGIFLITVFFIFPIIFVTVISFCKWNGVTAPAFIGLRNYTQLFGDAVFWRSIRNNIIWVAATCGIRVPLALLMAMVLSAKPKGWKFFRTVYFLPQVMSLIALATLWSAVYNSEFGLLNGLLKTLGMGELARNWLGDPKTALACVLIYELFYIGYYMVIMMAGISGIDPTFYEAATIDGASRIQMEWHITMPMIKPSIVSCITLAAVYSLRTFQQVYLLTNGGPANRTSVLVLYLYKQMNNNNYGGANASSVMLILTGVIIMVGIRILSSEKDTKRKGAWEHGS